MSSMPSFFNVSTTEQRLLRIISGTLDSAKSVSKDSLVYRRKHFPGRVRPARPARCIALALEMAETSNDSEWVLGL
eukprot:CAMPEP_0178424838 /NCGR_PEP_ID=MMETSP0689_2-20121128/28417_1 /TAXON_ID=160604 /ORGANISM="Amphidinium massartii, Strain CS-259" /LENGTH=75 /DNA_ID=CAMNT_0020046489 /DNA_START=737 /DNA_END=964 /DNA_ORIENTATION=+